MTAFHVLIVDDDPALLQALPQTLRLRMDGVTVETADSAAAALDRIAAHDYDVIVTDIKMPGMDGLALLAEIRGRQPDTPTLMITGHGEYNLAVQALRGGAYDFMQKPIDRDFFVASLNRAIQMREQSRRVKDRQSALERCAGELEWIVEKLGRKLPPRPRKGKP
jgi:DNA-binding NtrC family response regulator